MTISLFNTSSVLFGSVVKSWKKAHIIHDQNECFVLYHIGTGHSEQRYLVSMDLGCRWLFGLMCYMLYYMEQPLLVCIGLRCRCVFQGTTTDALLFCASLLCRWLLQGTATEALLVRAALWCRWLLQGTTTEALLVDKTGADGCYMEQPLRLY